MWLVGIWGKWLWVIVSGSRLKVGLFEEGVKYAPGKIGMHQRCKRFVDN
jgi:hypothetical protein